MSEGDDSEFEEQEESFTEGSAYKKRIYLFAIDTHESMFLRRMDGTYPFGDCIEAFNEIIEPFMFSTRSQHIGSISLKTFDENQENAYFFKFNDLIRDAIETLKELKSLEYNEVKSKYCKNDVNFSRFLLNCNKAFMGIKEKDVHKTVVFITTNPNPVDDDGEEKSRAIAEFQKLVDFGIYPHLIALCRDFDFSLFYKEPITSATDVCFCLDLIGLLEKLFDYLMPKDRIQQVLFYPFKSNQRKHLKLMIRKFLWKPKLGCPQLVTSDEHVPIVKQIVEAETTDTVKLAMEDGTELEFTEDEMKLFYAEVEELGYHLICVSDRQSNIGEDAGKSTILQAHHTEVLPHFNYFYKYCVKNNKVLICKYVSSKSRIPHLVEFIPKTVNGVPSFLARPLLSLDNIEYLMDADDVPVAISDDEISSAEKLVEALTVTNFDLKLLTDPTFEKEKAYVKSEALGEELKSIEEEVISSEMIDEKLEGLEFVCANVKRGAEQKTTREKKSRKK